MGHRTLVASGESSTVPSDGTVVKFPSTGNIWQDRDLPGLADVRVMASLSASANYTVALAGSYQDPDSGSVYNGIIEQFAPGDTLGDGAGEEVFRSQGKHVHHEWVEITFSSSSDLTVNQLGVVWESA